MILGRTPGLGQSRVVSRVSPLRHPSRVSNREPAAPPGGAPRWVGWLAAGVLTVLGLTVYANALGHPFAADDQTIILNDMRIRQGDLQALPTGAYWPPPSRNALYCQLVKITYALNLRISDQPIAFRIPNLALHVGVAWLVFLLTWDVIRAAGGAAPGEPPELRDLPQAWRLGQVALELSPHHAAIIDTCADIMVALGRTADAVPLIHERLPGVPANDEHRAALAAKLAKLEAKSGAAGGANR
jgi:hypothetical protein